MILTSFLLREVSKRVPANQIHGLRGLKNWKRDSAGIRTQGPQLRRLLLYPTELRNLPKVGLDRCGIKMDPKRDQKCKKNAERKGFEPLEVVSLNGFQDRRNRPLCHLSESVSRVRNPPIWGAKVLPKFFLCKSFRRFF